ncbi:hypothetical protein [Streptomyces sp. NBC_01198]|uniref:vWA-MoxR associated conflict system protein n=1 Tax=Streptomyces sp. NBC_01198 TaxID=2903769 RepID=UPI002E165B3B|nr:hypothetical protein OG702_01945 [Streptomyces sp. NBC_01198]
MTHQPPYPGQWEKWKRTEPARLACYVDPRRIADRFGAGLGSTHDVRDADRRATARLLYDHLAGQSLRYETAEIDSAAFHEAEQVIRPPDRVVAEGGNCLELTLLFAGLCLHHKLRTLVVLLEDHALAAVWLDGDLDEVWPAGRPAGHDHRVMSGGLLNPAPPTGTAGGNLAALVAEGRYLLVECTGLTTTGRRPRRNFDAAVAEGLARIGRQEVVGLVDVAFHQRTGLYPPYPPPAAAPRRSLEDTRRGSEAPVTGAHPGPVTGHLAAVPATRPLLGALGARVLGSGLGDAAPAIPALAGFAPTASWSRPDLLRLLGALDDATACMEKNRLTTTVEGLVLALGAQEFITAWMPQAVTPAGLRRALLACVADSARVSPQGLSDHLAAVVLYRPVTEPDARASLLGFVLRLAVGSGVDTADDRFHWWCLTDGYDIAAANSLRQRLRTDAETRRTRLVIELRSTGAHDRSGAGDLAAWLLDEKGRSTASRQAADGPPGTGTVEEQLADVMEWAYATATVPLLSRVDLALPTGTLLRRWQPEDADVGTRLGAQHEVVVHWGGRIEPPGVLRRFAPVVAHRLRQIEQAEDAYGSVDWVSPETADAQDQFEERLSRNDYPGALGLRFEPAGRDDLFELLLAQFPVLLWPRGPVAGWDTVEEHVRDQWVNLPGGLTTAYRAAWGCEPAAVPPLAGVRAVWDDAGWLAFCRETSRFRAGIAPGDGVRPGGRS